MFLLICIMYIVLLVMFCDSGLEIRVLSYELVGRTSPGNEHWRVSESHIISTGRFICLCIAHFFFVFLLCFPCPRFGFSSLKARYKFVYLLTFSSLFFTFIFLFCFSLLFFSFIFLFCFSLLFFSIFFLHCFSLLFFSFFFLFCSFLFFSFVSLVLSLLFFSFCFSLLFFSSVLSCLFFFPVFFNINHASGNWRLFDLSSNSIQFRHLYAPAYEHHVGAHGEEKKTYIIYMYNNKVHEWETEKQIKCGLSISIAIMFAGIHETRDQCRFFEYWCPSHRCMDCIELYLYRKDTILGQGHLKRVMQWWIDYISVAYARWHNR